MTDTAHMLYIANKALHNSDHTNTANKRCKAHSDQTGFDDIGVVSPPFVLLLWSGLTVRDVYHFS
jgi:hypothetical protein